MGWGSLIEGRFVYAVGLSRFPLAKPKRGRMLMKNRQLDAIFFVKCFQEFSETNASVPTVQLHRILVALAVIAYRRWDFRAMDAPGDFLRSEPLKRDTYAKLPDVVEKGNIERKLLKPMYRLSTSCKHWCATIRDFRANARGGESYGHG